MPRDANGRPSIGRLHLPLSFAAVVRQIFAADGFQSAELPPDLIGSMAVHGRNYHFAVDADSGQSVSRSAEGWMTCLRGADLTIPTRC